ncbi:MAG: hypothetical protein ACNYZI_11305, partial [Anaerolineales bacterium]
NLLFLFTDHFMLGIDLSDPPLAFGLTLFGHSGEAIFDVDDLLNFSDQAHRLELIRWPARRKTLKLDYAFEDFPAFPQADFPFLVEFAQHLPNYLVLVDATLVALPLLVGLLYQLVRYTRPSEEQKHIILTPVE